MKILLVSNFYYNRGGDCTYLFSLKKLLERKGHQVVVFSMHHPQNYESPYSQYFVSYIDYAEEIKNKSIRSGFKVLKRSMYSVEAKRRIEELIIREKPDIVHLNNIRHHITPSILPVINKLNVPIIWTLHDYQLICPNISFLSGGEVCERCRKRKYYWPLLVRCKKGSVLASAMASVEHSFQVISKVYDNVDVFICPSKFLESKFSEYDFQKNKLVHLNYFHESDVKEISGASGDYILYVGRISGEKGVKTLIDAVLQIDGCKLKIVGDGPVKEQLASYLKDQGGEDRITFLGHLSHEEVMQYMKKCKFLVIPSEWYEVTGLVIFEAYACGKPVVGSRIGGIPEYIKENTTGVTFSPGDTDDLTSKIEYLLKSEERLIEMGKHCVTYVKEELNGEIHYNTLIELYKNAINKRSLTT